MNGVPAVTNQSDKTSDPGAPTGPASPGAPPPAPAGSAITGYKIEPLVLPAATGGDGTLVHALSPALPAGVELEEASRTVSGTPDAARPATVYSWTATDENGDTRVVCGRGRDPTLSVSRCPYGLGARSSPGRAAGIRR